MEAREIGRRLWASILSISRCQALSWREWGGGKDSFQLRWSAARGNAAGLTTLLHPWAVTASPPGSLRTSDWVVLNCSFSRPDLPASVHWFRGPGRVPIQESPHHHLVGSFLFLPQVSPLDSGPWGCILTYRDGFNVSNIYNLTVLGNFSSAFTLHHNAFLPPCHLPPTYRSPKQGLCS